MIKDTDIIKAADEVGSRIEDAFKSQVPDNSGRILPIGKIAAREIKNHTLELLQSAGVEIHVVPVQPCGGKREKCDCPRCALRA